MEELWNYYKSEALRCGKTIIEGKEKQSSFSIAWFYQNFDGCDLGKALNPLTKAFLGEEAAYRAVHRASEDELRTLRADVAECLSREAKKPNESQIEAIANAASNQITIIQGPPGTGKTETIKNLLLFLMDMNPVPTVAVVSSNQKAIQNIVEKVENHPGLCSKYAHLGSKDMRAAFYNGHKEFAATLPWTSGVPDKLTFPPALLERFPIVFSTIHSLNRCVYQQGRGYFRYDYVIVDECSQVSSALGLLAMSAAKHLVLLGDSEQLPPVYKDDGEDKGAVPDVEPYYLDEGDHSFMKACHERFGEKAGRVMLNEHYRCHPAIIGFCNEIAYHEELIVQTKDDGRLPIRVRWYEGDYWELVPWGKKGRKAEKKQKKDDGKKKNFNEKQIQVFIQDECPYILKKFREDSSFAGFCVLSPYNDQLERLKYEVDASGALKALPGYSCVEKGGDSDSLSKYTFTVHKVQGGEYPLVYIMPVQDTGKDPWGQKKELVNVAVSRAQEELCVITSASWMPAELQKKLLGYVANTGGSDSADLYVAKLLRYVYEEQNHRIVGENFGFQRSSIHSVFDKTLYWRQRFRDEKIDRPDTSDFPSAPECCMMKALESLEGQEKSDKYQIFREFPLKGVDGISSDDPEVQTYIDNNARFDFVICKKGRIYAIIEVDGAYHRNGNVDVERDDRLKDAAVRSLGSAFSGRYFRLPTDGTTRDEMEAVAKLLAGTEGNENDLPAVRSDCAVIQCLNALLSKCLINLQLELERQGYDKIVKEVSFEDQKLPAYGNKGHAAYYILRYANYNTLEYALMYQLAFRMLKEEYAAVYSFGCGPVFDGLSCVYAKNKLETSALDGGVKRLTYRGVDIAEWPYRIDLEALALDMVWPHNYYHGMNEFMTSMRGFSGNVLFFPKVLSEIDANIDDFCEQLKNAPLNNGRMLLCISYRSRYTYENGSDWKQAKKIINAMEDKGYTASKEIPPEFHEMDWAEYFEAHPEPKDGYPCFVAKSEDVNENIYQLYDEFRLPKGIEDYLRWDIRKACPRYPALKETYTETHPGDRIYPDQVCEAVKCPDAKHCRTSARKNFFSQKNTGACFQVLLFTKR